MKNYGSLIKSITIGTTTIICLSLFIGILNIWDADEYLCLEPARNVLSNIPAILLNQLTHESLWHLFIAILIFPFVATTMEAEIGINASSPIGTIQFLALFFIASFLISTSYITMMFFVSFIVPSWGIDCVSGLDIPFFFFLTVDGLSGRGLFEVTTALGINIPRNLYFVPYFALLGLILPYSAWIPRLVAVMWGCLYYLGSGISFPDGYITSMENSWLLRKISDSPNFVIKPGAVQLPMPGSYGDQNAAEPSTTFISHLTNMVQPATSGISSTQYIPAQQGGLERTADPLLWEEDEEDIKAPLIKSNK